MERSFDIKTPAHPHLEQYGGVDPLRLILEHDGVLVWRPCGRSMRPLIRSGKDVVTIAPHNGTIKPWDVVLYSRVTQGEYQHVLHRVLSVEDGLCTILGDNCVSVEWVPLENIMGVMTALERKGKPVDYDGWWYRAYLRWWVQPWRRRVAVLRRTHALRHAVGKALPQSVKDRIGKLF